MPQRGVMTGRCAREPVTETERAVAEASRLRLLSLAPRKCHPMNALAVGTTGLIGARAGVLLAARTTGRTEELSIFLSPEAALKFALLVSAG